jgi:hypothetical protein
LRAASPEQKIIWNNIFLRWGENVAISQLFYQGVLGGREFNLYFANKMYFALDVCASNHGVPTNTRANLTFYDETNTESFVARDTDIEYAILPEWYYSGNILYLKNFLFSRAVPGEYGYFRFIGYRLTIGI